MVPHLAGPAGTSPPATRGPSPSTVLLASATAVRPSSSSLRESFSLSEHRGYQPGAGPDEEGAPFQWTHCLVITLYFLLFSSIQILTTQNLTTHSATTYHSLSHNLPPLHCTQHQNQISLFFFCLILDMTAWVISVT